MTGNSLKKNLIKNKHIINFRFMKNNKTINFYKK